MDVVLIRQSTAQWLREVVASLWYALGPQLASVLSVMVKGVAMAELCRYPESGVDFVVMQPIHRVSNTHSH